MNVAFLGLNVLWEQVRQDAHVESDERIGSRGRSRHFKGVDYGGYEATVSLSGLPKGSCSSPLLHQEEEGAHVTLAKDMERNFPVVLYDEEECAIRWMVR